jgi:hypothetical protein
MVQLEKSYRKERIPGIRVKVDKAVESELPGDGILAEYNTMTNEEVYDLCPFSTFLDTYPDRSDWTALSGFQKKLDSHMRKELGTWAQNIITHLRERLYPKKPGHLGY